MHSSHSPRHVLLHSNTLYPGTRACRYTGEGIFTQYPVHPAYPAYTLHPALPAPTAYPVYALYSYPPGIWDHPFIPDPASRTCLDHLVHATVYHLPSGAHPALGPAHPALITQPWALITLSVHLSTASPAARSFRNSFHHMLSCPLPCPLSCTLIMPTVVPTSTSQLGGCLSSRAGFTPGSHLGQPGTSETWIEWG